MANRDDRRRFSYMDGSLAYDLNSLARERALDEAGRMDEVRRAEPVAAPRRQPAARPAAKVSPLTITCAAVLTGLVIVLLMGYVRLTEVSAGISEMKTEIGQLQEQHVSLLTQYEKTYDLATIKQVAEEAGMKKPTGGQIEYIELPVDDSAVVYRSDVGTTFERLLIGVKQAASTVVEYFR